jgi:hypothetical protein
MKRIIFAVVAVLLAVSFVTCDEWMLPGDDDAIVEYTDVEYSQDGKQIKICIDGTKPIPVTKGQKRAMSRDLALMAYDFFEVIFVSGATIARASWELGQPAGISGVARGINYASMSTDPYACMFVGKTDGKTLLGVGMIMDVDATPGANVLVNSGYVTFAVSAIQTGLAIGGESLAVAGVPIDSFDFASGGSTGTYTSRVGHSSRSALGGVSYPMYSLNPEIDVTQFAVYKFGYIENTGDAPTLTTTNINLAIKIAGPIEIQKRLPRYMDSGHYLVPRSHIDTKSTVILRTAQAVNSSFSGQVDLTFTTKGSGIFSFYIKIPVYMVRTAATAPNFKDEDSTNSGPKPVKWFITTGLDSELYSLDDGKSSGGCVLMGAGISDLEFLIINWKWIEEPAGP